MNPFARTLTAAGVAAATLAAGGAVHAVSDPADASVAELDLRGVDVTFRDGLASIDLTFNSNVDFDLSSWPAGAFVSVVVDVNNDNVDDYEYRMWRTASAANSRIYRYNQPTTSGPGNPGDCFAQIDSSSGPKHLQLNPRADCLGITGAFQWRARTGIDSVGDGTSIDSFVDIVDQVPDSGRRPGIIEHTKRAPIEPTLPGRPYDSREHTPGRLAAGDIRRINIASWVGVGVHDIAGAVLNVTAVNPTGPGHLTVYPCKTSSDPAPHTSNVNYTAGQVVANEVIVGVTSGGVCVRTITATDVVVDVTGWIPAGSVVKTATPMRFADTRPANPTIDTLHSGEGPIGAGRTKTIQITGRRDVPAGAVAAILNVTAANAAGPGHLTVHPCAPTAPNASNVNYTPGAAVAGAVVAALDSRGRICVTTPTTVDVIVDVAGWVLDGDGIDALAPARLADTRPGASTIDGKHAGGGRLHAGETRAFTVTGRGGAGGSIDGVLVNVTAVNPDSYGHITVFPCGYKMPVASNLNYTPGQVVANAVVVPVPDSGQICVYSLAGADIVIDLAGQLVAI